MKKSLDKVENSDVPPSSLLSTPLENAEKKDEGIKEKPNDVDRQNLKNVDVAILSDKNSQNEVDNSFMPPPCLPSKPLAQTEKSSEGMSEKHSIREKKETGPELPYKVPSWSGLPDDFYSLEVLKNGCIISNIDLANKPFHVFGRLPNCDVSLEHPSVSRYHAVIQYKRSDSSNSERGFYIYDLGSTHGTTVNKSPLEAKRYYRLRVGYVFKFGGSSRLFILQGPEDSGEAELDQDAKEEPTQKIADVGRVMTEEEYEEWKKDRDGRGQDGQDTGIDWGMGEDAVEEPAFLGEIDKESEQHHFKDPKKTLRGFFEREGLELEYDVEEKGPGHARVYHCKVKLPIDGPGGESIYAEAAVAGRKKEAVLECAQEACRMLDAAGLLRQSSHESRKHKEKNWEENDFYDSDEDAFLDRTGSVEKKRIQRMKRAGKDEPTMETYETLTLKLEAVDKEIQDCESKLQKDVAGKEGENLEGADSLDNYMKCLGTSIDKTTKTKLKRKAFDLKKEKERLVKLQNIAKPANLPSFAQCVSTESSLKSEVPSQQDTISIGNISIMLTTVDNHTDSRHQSSAAVEATVESRDLGPISHQERRQEFAIPALPVLLTGNIKTQKKEYERLVEKKETNIIDKEENLVEQDRENQKGRKRYGSHDALEEQNEEIEMNLGSPKKKKAKRSYHVPSHWEAVNDPTYAGWTPPEGQTGDGRTHLNEKFGY